jgi:hypothetical protein
MKKDIISPTKFKDFDPSWSSFEKRLTKFRNRIKKLSKDINSRILAFDYFRIKSLKSINDDIRYKIWYQEDKEDPKDDLGYDIAGVTDRKTVEVDIEVLKKDLEDNINQLNAAISGRKYIIPLQSRIMRVFFDFRDQYIGLGELCKMIPYWAESNRQARMNVNLLCSDSLRELDDILYKIFDDIRDMSSYVGRGNHQWSINIYDDDFFHDKIKDGINYIDIVMFLLNAERAIKKLREKLPMIVSIMKVSIETHEIYSDNKYNKLYLFVNRYFDLAPGLIRDYIAIMEDTVPIAQKFFLSLGVNPKYFEGPIALEVGLPPLRYGGLYSAANDLITVERSGLNPKLDNFAEVIIHEMAHRIYYKMGNILRNKWEIFHNEISRDLTEDEKTFVIQYVRGEKITVNIDDHISELIKWTLSYDSPVKKRREDISDLKESIILYNPREYINFKAISLSEHFPTYYSLTNHQESFAESVTYEYKDPSRNGDIVRRVIGAIFA